MKINETILYEIELALVYNNKLDVIYKKLRQSKKEYEQVYAVFLGDTIVEKYKSNTLHMNNIVLLDRKGQRVQDESIRGHIIEDLKEVDLYKMYEEVVCYLNTTNTIHDDNFEEEEMKYSKVWIAISLLTLVGYIYFMCK